MFNMEKYAVIKLASKQYLVREGDVIKVERQQKPLKIEVLFYSEGDTRIIGEPEVKDLSVKAIVLEEKLDKKVRVARFKSKSRYDKVRGHRQPISVIKIEKISKGKADKDEEVKKPVKEEVKPTVKSEVKKKSPGRPAKKADGVKKEVRKTVSKQTSKNLKGTK
ncbi:50S ribosomal protein L21 [Patescibacteria group bacterium]|nr:50S ribosomal protein L21 [Patescibacteria group bacterium]